MVNFRCKLDLFKKYLENWPSVVAGCFQRRLVCDMLN
jgi:hypothetical protein